MLVTADPFGLGARLSLAGAAFVALIVLATSRTIPESRARVVGVADPLGALLLGAAIITIVLPLGLSAMAGPGLVVTMLSFSAVLFLAFVLWQRHLTPQRALVPLPALRERPLQIGLAQTLLFFAGYGGFTYYFSTTMQAGLDLAALPTSALMMPFAGGFVLSSALLPLLLERMAPRRAMVVGVLAQVLLLGVIAAVIEAGAQDPPLVTLCLLLTLLGIAQAAMYGPLIGSVMGSLDAGLSGVASGLFSTLQQVGVALGVPLFGLVLSVMPAVPGHAFALCVGVQVLFSAGFAVLIGRPRGASVHLAGCFSNPRKPVKTLIRRVLRESQRSRRRSEDQRIEDVRGPVAKNSLRPQTRLSVPNRAALADAYASGTSVDELAQRFGVHRQTALRIIAQTGLDIPRRGLALKHVREAARLYESGLTLVEVGRKFDIGPDAVRRVLSAAGVTIRRRGRRAKAAR